MTEQSPVTEDKPDYALKCIFSFMAGIIVAVVALHYYGYLKHTERVDEAKIAEFSLLTLKPGYDVKVSTKDSGKEAFCDAGYRPIRPQNDKAVAGILVDEKNRGVHCQSGLLPVMPEGVAE